MAMKLAIFFDSSPAGGRVSPCLPSDFNALVVATLDDRAADGKRDSHDGGAALLVFHAAWACGGGGAGR